MRTSTTVSTPTLLLLILGLAAAGCSSKELRSETYPNGQKKAEGYVVQDDEGNYLLTGLWTYWHENGQKQAEGEYKDARGSGERGDTGILEDGREGLWLFWHENGNKKSEATFVGGMREGPAIAWRESGTKRSEAHYTADRLDGVVTVWREGGEKAAETTYVAGNKHGTHRRWHANGQLQEEGAYTDGRRFGDWASWSSSGESAGVESYPTIHVPPAGSQLPTLKIGSVGLRLGAPRAQVESLFPKLVEKSQPDEGTAYCQRGDFMSTCLLFGGGVLVGIDRLHQTGDSCNQTSEWKTELASALDAVGAAAGTSSELRDLDAINDYQRGKTWEGTGLEVSVMISHDGGWPMDCTLKVRAAPPE